MGVGDLSVKHEWKTNYNTKRHMLFYDFERLWLFLTLLNLVAVFLIIRGSTAPLLSDNVVLRFLFYSKETGDKTLYNIAISYFAAYIFYIIQVYHPERQRTKRALMNIASPAVNLINQTFMFLFIWDAFVKKDEPNEGTILDVDIRKIYYKNNSGLVLSSDKDELRKNVGRVQESYEEIMNDSTFQNSDNALRQLLMERNIPVEINKLYQTLISAELLSKSESPTILETYSVVDVADIKERLKRLDSLLGLECDCHYTITTDAKDIKQREDNDKIALRVILENLDYFEGLPESYKNSLKQ